MASIRNIAFEDQGVNWRVSFEYTNDQQTEPWTEFEARFPADFDDINSTDRESIMFTLAVAVARGQGVEI